MYLLKFLCLLLLSASIKFSPTLMGTVVGKTLVIYQWGKKQLNIEEIRQIVSY